jgi:hypothetical protein
MAVKIRERNGKWWLFVDWHGQRKKKCIFVLVAVVAYGAQITSARVIYRCTTKDGMVFSRESPMPDATCEVIRDDTPRPSPSPGPGWTPRYLATPYPTPRLRYYWSKVENCRYAQFQGAYTERYTSIGTTVAQGEIKNTSSLPISNVRVCADEAYCTDAGLGLPIQPGSAGHFFLKVPSLIGFTLTVECSTLSAEPY